MKNGTIKDIKKEFEALKSNWIDDEEKHYWPGSQECFHRAVPVLVLRPATLQHFEPVIAAVSDSSDDTFDIFLALLA